MISKLGKYVSILYRQEQKYISHVIKPFGIGYSDYHFLLYIFHFPGVSQKEMCQSVAIDEALAARTMKKLESLELVRRQRREDGRSYELYLTEKAMEMIPVLKDELSHWWGRLTESISPKQQEELLQLLQQMADFAMEELQKNRGKTVLEERKEITHESSQQ